MIKVTAVQPGTIAEELGLVAGSELLTVNGRTLEDFLGEHLHHFRRPPAQPR